MRFLSLLLWAALAGAAPAADSLPELGDTSQTVITGLQERLLGEQVMRQIRAAKEYVDDPEISDYINDLGFKLAANSPDAQHAFEFFVIEDKSINAFALPGGFIGVNTGLIQTAQSESELAGVLSHEIGHVTQRHMARMFQKQKQASLVSLAAMALALLAARTSGDLASAAVAGAQYAGTQPLLNFSRDNEREADRVGVQILEKSGFDPRAMPVFLDRMQRAYQIYETGAPSYVRTHPLTFERIADVESRVQGLPYRQVPNSLEFELVRTRLQVGAMSPHQGVDHFQAILSEKRTVNENAARYGVILALLRTKDLSRAQREMAILKQQAAPDAMIDALAASVKVAAGDLKGAAAVYEDAVKRFPRRRGLVYGYARVLLDFKRPGEALVLITDALQSARLDSKLYRMQAEAYAALGQKLQQHRAQAEAYLLLGSLPGAIEQLQLGLKSGDGDYYQLSSAEARLRELRDLDAQMRKRR